MAAAAASNYLSYRSRSCGTSQTTTWVQIDLGATQSIDAVRLYPFHKPHNPPGDGFPLRFRIECADDAAFGSPLLIADWSKADFPDPQDQIIEFPGKTAAGRYVRLTATRLRAQQPATSLMPFIPEKSHSIYLASLRATHRLSLSKLEVLSGGMDLALHRPVTVDGTLGHQASAQQLTRARRPQGEGIITDHPENVTAPETWKAVPFQANAPRGTVVVDGTLFRTALQNNIRYLLNSFSANEMLHQFRERAGRPPQPLTRKPHPFWDEQLAGQSAGRFLMGAGNTLRWIESAELRERMNTVVEGIAECRQPNGYIMAYPEDAFFVSERGAYTRAWVTHGLIEAGYAGNGRAFELLRGYYDGYNGAAFLPQALRGCAFGPQGTVANTRMYFTPVGKPLDLQVVQRYLQEDYWLDALASRQVDAIWQYPYDRPHCYLITFLEPYLDLFRATGDRRYLEAVLGGWDLIRENWQSIGGSIALQEYESCPPKANPLYEKHRGETCGSAFWILLNQRLHLLDPGEEKYVTEIEKSIYNVLLANQADSQGIRFHTRLVGQKDAPQCVANCCEGQATRILGSLPEYIYSVADDGVYVNLFERSAISWKQSNGALRLEMETDFPRRPEVRLSVHVTTPTRSKLRVRVPSWATSTMQIEVNGDHAAIGSPGSYVTLHRTWSQGDVVSFTLPMALKLTRYAGVDQIEGRKRFCLEYGPLLMAALGATESPLTFEALTGVASPNELVEKLQPVPDQPLHFRVPLDFSGTTWVPYFEIQDESFSCFPVIEIRSGVL